MAHPAQYADFNVSLPSTSKYAITRPELGTWSSVPGIYFAYTASGGKYVVSSDIQTVFDNAAKYWTHSNVRCRGLWTAEPEPCGYCTSTADVSANWGQFATTKQYLTTGTVEVPLYLRQYAEHGEHTTTVTSGCTYYCGYSNFAGGQNLDLDGSDSRGGETYMFRFLKRNCRAREQRELPPGTYGVITGVQDTQL